MELTRGGGGGWGERAIAFFACSSPPAPPLSSRPARPRRHRPCTSRLSGAIEDTQHAPCVWWTRTPTQDGDPGPPALIEPGESLFSAAEIRIVRSVFS